MRVHPRELVQRLLTLAKTPERAWAEIREEEAQDFWDILPSAALMAALPPLATAIGALFGGVKLFLLALLLAPLAWIILLGGVWVVSYGVYAFAPYLGSQPNFSNSLKLVTWGLSAFWISALLNAIPFLYVPLLGRLAGVVGTCYLWYYGFPSLLGTPRQPPTSLALFAFGAGFSYSTLTYLLQTLFISSLLGPLLLKILPG